MTCLNHLNNLLELTVINLNLLTLYPRPPPLENKVNNNKERLTQTLSVGDKPLVRQTKSVYFTLWKIITTTDPFLSTITDQYYLNPDPIL